LAQLALAQARVNSGLGLPSDVVRAQTSVAEAILNLDVARNNASVARVNLNRLMGIDPRTPYAVAEGGEPPVSIDDLNALIVAAQKRRPEVLQAQANLQAAEHGVNAAKATNAPAVSADIGAFTRGSDFPPRQSFLSIGASVSWDPFDGGLTAGRVREAEPTSILLARMSSGSARTSPRTSPSPTSTFAPRNSV
jgi:outer membrane protein TolC